ncbi:TPA: hypothetical protein HA251_06875 [Candidatus Woesearchaeota archaeon]|nr:hypothetical protein [Candidatus Woesearchaeota archaeon]
MDTKKLLMRIPKDDLEAKAADAMLSTIDIESSYAGRYEVTFLPADTVQLFGLQQQRPPVLLLLPVDGVRDGDAYLHGRPCDTVRRASAPGFDRMPEHYAKLSSEFRYYGHVTCTPRAEVWYTPLGIVVLGSSDRFVRAKSDDALLEHASLTTALAPVLARVR